MSQDPDKCVDPANSCKLCCVIDRGLANDRDKWISLNFRFYWVNRTRRVGVGQTRFFSLG